MNAKPKEISGEVIERGRAVAASQAGAVTPMEMLDRALSSGATPETIEKFMAMAERYKQGQAREAFESALAATRGELKPIARNATGHNDKRYVSLDAMALAVDPILAAHGLSYRYRTQQTPTVITVTCILFGHGHSEESTLSGPADASGNKNAIQAIGSTLTYLQRYALAQAIGVAAARDDDGHAAGKQPKEQISEADADKMRDTVRALVTEVKMPIAKFLTWAKAESISDIPAGDLKDVIASLNERKRKMGATS